MSSPVQAPKMLAPPKAPRTLSAAATAIIKGVYASAAKPIEPHRALTDAARSVAVFGDLLGQLSDTYFKAGKKYASMLATIGRVLWGVVELSVPKSIGLQLSRYWLKLLTALAVLMIVCGIVFNVGAMTTFGWEFVAAIILAYLLRWLLRGYMLTAKWPKIATAVAVVVAVVAPLLWLAIAYGDKIGSGFIWMHNLPGHLGAAMASVWAWLQKRAQCKC